MDQAFTQVLFEALHAFRLVAARLCGDEQPLPPLRGDTTGQPQRWHALASIELRQQVQSFQRRARSRFPRALQVSAHRRRFRSAQRFFCPVYQSDHASLRTGCGPEPVQIEEISIRQFKPLALIARGFPIPEKCRDKGLAVSALQPPGWLVAWIDFLEHVVALPVSEGSDRWMRGLRRPGL